MDKRIDFNEGSYKEDLYQSLGPGYYRTFSGYANHVEPRRISDIGYNGTHGSSIRTDKSLIDNDSELRIKYYATKDPTRMFMKNTCVPEPNNLHFSERRMNVDYTRQSNPLILAPECSKNRFESLYIDHQHSSRWKTPFLIGEQSRWSGR